MISSSPAVSCVLVIGIYLDFWDAHFLQTRYKHEGHADSAGGKASNFTQEESSLVDEKSENFLAEIQTGLRGK